MHRIYIAFCFWASVWAKPLDFSVQARSAILMNAETGAVLYEKNAHSPSFPASITKIATALLVLDQRQDVLDELVTVSSEALKHKPAALGTKGVLSYWLERDGTMMGLVKGELVSYESLLHGLMLVSGNDAANVLAEKVAGSVPDFMGKLNEYVKDLGCLNTQFRNPHGLHDPEHYTTAHDICLITKKALKNAKFREIVSKVAYSKPKNNKQSGIEIRQTNPLIRVGSKYRYAKAIGVKTGFHSNSGPTIVAAAEHEGRTLIAVLLGCKQKQDRCEDTIRLFETAFAEEKKHQRLIGPESHFTHKVEGGNTHLEAALQRELTISFYPAEEPAYRAFVRWDACPLPIQKGQKVGVMEIVDSEGNRLTQGDLLATHDVKQTFWFWCKQLFR